MRYRKSILAAFGPLLVILAMLTTKEAGANNYSVSGAVTDQNKKALTGVMVTAFDAVENKSITVFSKQGGKFKLPGLTGRDYKLRARLPGFDDVFVSLPDRRERAGRGRDGLDDVVFEYRRVLHGAEDRHRDHRRRNRRGKGESYLEPEVDISRGEDRGNERSENEAAYGEFFGSCASSE